MLNSNRIPFVCLFFSFFMFIVFACQTRHKPTNHPHSTLTHTKLNNHSKQKKTHTKHTPIVISDTSFESGMSEDYAIPPDALSQADSTYMDASLPSILMRSSYVDSPNKKMESLEKVNICM